MKVLIVGDWSSDLYEKAFFDSFNSIDIYVDKFSWIEYFKYYQYPALNKCNNNKILSFYYRFQNRFSIGPAINKINNDLIDKSLLNNYDLIFIYRGVHIYPTTIKKLKKFGAVVFGYNNDDPFAPFYPFYFWRHFKKGLKYYDHVFSYRQKNIQEYLNSDVKSVSLLRSYYIKEKNYPIVTNGHNEEVEVVFIGHFENDGRDEIILGLHNSGIKIKVYGTNWNKSCFYNQLVKFNGDIVPIYNEKYNEVLNKSDISLVFLSKINNDTYTRRVFEIPITKTVMVCERNDDIQNLFNDKKEIILFDSKDDCIRKVNELVRNRDELESIKLNSYNRLINDGHEVVDRVRVIISTYNKIKYGDIKK
ncbi:glycosyltransferase [Photobacterium leiognathi]|uniref:glycosyltransferase n=1 Tax=Photobacterium leiognathi TaxID=553611 RepID=UPI0029817DBB|nr:glycosyltransferase [Photobacterium leiognathi]